MIQTARHHHEHKQYDASRECYEEAFNLLSLPIPDWVSTEASERRGFENSHHSLSPNHSAQTGTKTVSSMESSDKNGADDVEPHRTGTPIACQMPSSPILDFLVMCFMTDYGEGRLSPDHAGWRTLMDIVETLKIPRSQVYGDAKRGRAFARPLEELAKAGVIEWRIFPHQRGRGGRIVKVRASSGSEQVRGLIGSNV